MIGAGNVAFHLSQALQKSGFNIIQVYSRTEISARELAEKLSTSFTTGIRAIDDRASLYVIAVKDDVIPFIIDNLRSEHSLVVHTAGSVSLQVFEGKCANYGVLYPLQTFSKSRFVDFSQVPVFLEANTPDNLQTLKTIAGKISNVVYEANSAKRMQLHLAAVFGSNFVNYLYDIAYRIAGKAGFDFSALSALIFETAQKAIASGKPYTVQTGPAVRNDHIVMNKHLDMLHNIPEWQELYKVLSEGIREMQRSCLKS